MAGWIESHGFQIVLMYYGFASLVGSMPELPEGSGYWAKWAYQLLHAVAGNWRKLMEVKNLPVDEDGKTAVTSGKTPVVVGSKGGPDAAGT